MNNQKVKGYPTAYRNTSSGAIVFSNNNKYKQAKKLAEISKAKDDEISQLKRDMREMKSVINTIMKQIKEV